MSLICILTILIAVIWMIPILKFMSFSYKERDYGLVLFSLLFISLVCLVMFG